MWPASLPPHTFYSWDTVSKYWIIKLMSLKRYYVILCDLAPKWGALKRKETKGASWKKDRVLVSVVMYIEEGGHWLLQNGQEVS